MCVCDPEKYQEERERIDEDMEMLIIDREKERNTYSASFAAHSW